MLPSKKNLVWLAILFVVVIIVVAYSYTKTRNIKNDIVTDNATITASSSINIDKSLAQVDSDKDGLPDWEEALYGTDPKKPDTDGDGTPDGKEVALGRNPLIKGPNDLLVTNTKTKTSSATSTEKLTLTDTFARNFFTQYMNIQQSGVKITSDNASQVASDYLKSTPLPVLTAKQYTLKDLNLIDSDKARINNYHDSAAAIFAKYWPKGDPNELAIMQKAFVDNDSTALNSLTSVISSYQNTLNNLLLLAVPKLAESFHLNVLNSLSTYIQTLKMVQLANTDPLSALVGLNSYQTNQTNLTVNLANLQVYFINSLN